MDPKKIFKENKLIRAVVNFIYHRPKSYFSEIRKYGGFYNFYRVKTKAKLMRYHILKILKMQDPRPIGAKEIININFLSGHAFIHMTLLCIYSFYMFLTAEEKNKFCFNIYDDGTLKETDFNKIVTDFPFINVIKHEAIEQELEIVLPTHLFPHIRKRLITYPILKKLIYVHLNNKGLQPILDSDMVFIKRPDDLINWLFEASNNQQSTYYIQDTQRAYGFTDEIIEHLSSGKIPSKINGGLYCFHSDKVDFKRLENYIYELENNDGPQYLLEQALIAIIASTYNEHIPASEQDYIVYPNKYQVLNKQGILHHFVDSSKEFYYDYSWKQIVNPTIH